MQEITVEIWFQNKNYKVETEKDGKLMKNISVFVLELPTRIEKLKCLRRIYKLNFWRNDATT